MILVSGVATVDSAIDALRLGALDYLTKPLDNRRLKAVLAHVSRLRSLKDDVGTLRGELRKLGRFGRLIGVSPAMQKVYDLMVKVAPTDATVLISGESGTGKELVAQSVYELSQRRRKPFLPSTAARFPEPDRERAVRPRTGELHRCDTAAARMFRARSGGTLFLDEITEMPIELQVKLLRVLESGSLVRVGGDELVPVNVRLIAATNRVPTTAVQEGKLREDLYYRINVFPIVLPPLRDRDGDALCWPSIPASRVNASEGTSKRLSAAARDRIQAHPWRGNVRELKNELQRAFIMCESMIRATGLERRAGPRAAATGSRRFARGIRSVNSSLGHSRGAAATRRKRRRFWASASRRPTTAFICTPRPRLGDHPDFITRRRSHPVGTVRVEGSSFFEEPSLVVGQPPVPRPSPAAHRSSPSRSPVTP